MHVRLYGELNSATTAQISNGLECNFVKSRWSFIWHLLKFADNHEHSYVLNLVL